jgi:hypothetical protein
MLDGLVPHWNARFVPEFADARHARLIRQNVEGRHRQVEEKRMKRLVHHCGRVAS